MKKAHVLIMACSLMLGEAARHLVAGNTVKVSSRAQAAAEFSHLPGPSFSSVIRFVVGPANASASLSTGEVVAVAIKGQGENGSVNIGFTSNGLVNTGSTPWPHVTVTVTVLITDVAPGDPCCTPYVGVLDTTAGVSAAPKNSPGTYTITSQPFTMEPDREYKATGGIKCLATATPGAWVRAKVLSIKFNL